MLALVCARQILWDAEEPDVQCVGKHSRSQRYTKFHISAYTQSLTVDSSWCLASDAASILINTGFLQVSPRWPQQRMISLAEKPRLYMFTNGRQVPFGDRNTKCIQTTTQYLVSGMEKNYYSEKLSFDGAVYTKMYNSYCW